MLIDLSGRTALVTGASSGLGRAVARRLALSGARVAILARGADRLAEAEAEIGADAPGRVLAFPADVTDPAARAAALKAVTGRFGPVDILVNNAGSSRRGPLESLTRDDVVDDLDLKLLAPMALIQAVVPSMKERRHGRILNVSAIVGKAPDAGSMPTSLSRAGGLTLTRTLARELAPWNILVNALCVGKIKSGQWERRWKASDTGETYDAVPRPHRRHRAARPHGRGRGVRQRRLLPRLRRGLLRDRRGDQRRRGPLPGRLTRPAVPAVSAPTPGRILAAFAMVGVGGFGGAMPVIMHELVDRRRWLTPEDFAEILSLCQILPGANALNVAIVFGMRSAGWRGALAAVAGMLAAPVAVVLVLASLYSGFSDVPAVARATGVVASAAAGLVAALALRLVWTLRAQPLRLAVAVAVVALIAGLQVPLAGVIATVAPVALTLAAWERRRG